MFSSSFRKRNEYFFGSSVPSGFFWRRIYPICLFQASVQAVGRPCYRETANPRGSISSLSGLQVAISSLTTMSKGLSWEFQSFSLDGAAIQMKFGVKWEKTWHDSKNDRIHVTLDDCSSLCIAVTVCVQTLRRLGPISWRCWSMPFVNMYYLYTFNITPASHNTLRTCHTWSICCMGIAGRWKCRLSRPG